MAVQKNDSSGNIRLTSSGSDTGVTHAEDTIRSIEIKQNRIFEMRFVISILTLTHQPGQLLHMSSSDSFSPIFCPDLRQVRRHQFIFFL